MQNNGPYTKWTWDYLKEVAGDKKIPIYNNVKSDAYTPINKQMGIFTFGEYIDMIRKGPAECEFFFLQHIFTCTTTKKRFYMA